MINNINIIFFTSIILIFHSTVSIQALQIKKLLELKTLVSQNDFIYLQFLDFGCNYSRLFAAEYQDLFSAVGSKYPHLKFITISSEIQEIVQTYKIQGFPNVKMLVFGQIVEYYGELKSRKLILWIENILESMNLKILTKVSEIKPILSSYLACVLICQTENRNQLRVFQTLAAAYQNINFYFSTLKSAFSEIRPEFEYTFMVIRDFDTGNRILGVDQPFNFENMRNFLEAFKNPIVNLISRELNDEIFRKKETVILLFYKDGKSKDKETFGEFANKNKNRMRFVMCDYDSDYTADLLAIFGLSLNGINFVGIMKFGEFVIEKFVTKIVTEFGLNLFLENFDKNKLERFYKSENIPDSEKGLIKKVSAIGLQKVIMNTQKNIFLIIYNPRSALCKNYLDILGKIAIKLKEKDNLEILMMNGAENESQDIIVQKYPSLYLFKNGDKGLPVMYQGKNSMKELIKFLEKKLERKILNTELKSALIESEL